MLRKKQYADMVNMVQAVTELIVYFEPYKSIPKVGHLLTRASTLITELKDQVFKEFENSFTMQGVFNGDVNLLHDVCLVAEVVGKDSRNSIAEWYCDLQLKDYRSLFQAIGEVNFGFASYIDGYP
jgi:allophanate hydrolase subunit 1